MRDYEINSDLKQSKFENLKFVQGDTGSKIIVNLFEDSQSVNLTDCTVLAKYKRSDGYTDNKNASIEDNKITVEVDETMTSVVGTLKLIFEITYETTKKASTFMLLADISEGIGAKSTGGGTGDVIVDVDLSNYYNKQEIDKKLDNIANNFSSEQTENEIILKYDNKEILRIPLNSSDIDEPAPALIPIVNNLTNCINSNSATTVTEGESYNATITANEGYKLSSVTVSMNEEDVTSSCYSNGNINITSVTGRIVITASAKVDTDVAVGSVDSSNNIELSGLDAGTYSLKYEDDTGVLSNYDTIATVEVV